MNGATPNPSPTPLTIAPSSSSDCTQVQGYYQCSVLFPVPVATAVIIQLESFDASGNLLGQALLGPIDTEQATIPAQSVAIGGVIGSLLANPPSLSAADDGAVHTMTFQVTGLNADQYAIVPPGSYPTPISIKISGDPNGALSISPATVQSPGPNGSTAITLTYNSAIGLTQQATITASSGSANASLTFAPLIVSPSTGAVQPGASQTFEISEPGYAGAFAVSLSNTSLASLACPSSCTPSSPGGNVALTVTGLSDGSATLVVSDQNQASFSIPIIVGGASAGAPVVGPTPAIYTYSSAAGGTNWGITLGPDGQSVWFVDRVNAELGLIAQPAACTVSCTIAPVVITGGSTPDAQWIATTSDGSLYVSELAAVSGVSGEGIQQLTCSASVPSCTAEALFQTQIATPNVEQLLQAPDGNLYATAAALSGAGSIVYGAVAPNYAAGQSENVNASSPFGLTVDPTGTMIFYTDGQNVGYFSIPCAGNVCQWTEEPGNALYPAVRRPRHPLVKHPRRERQPQVPSSFVGPLAGIVSGPDGYIYVADPGAGTIDQITPSVWEGCNSVASCTDVSIPLPVAGAHPTNLIVGPDGNIWFTDTTGYVGFVSVSSCATVCTAYEYHIGGSPWGITDGPDGDIWFTENTSNVIGKIVLQ